jgi:hypothetical protein
LFTVGAILATPPEKEVKKTENYDLQNLGIIESDIELLEKEIDSDGRSFATNDTFCFARRTYYCVILSYCPLRLPSS